MRIAYLDCFSGISGDMFLGALVDAGVPASLLEETIAALNLGARMEISRVNRAAISATKVDVYACGEKDLPQEQYWEQRARREHTHAQNHEPVQLLEHNYAMQEAAPHEHQRQRGLDDIREIIAKAAISDSVKSTAVLIFETLGQAEAKIHNCSLEEVHFHEVGAVDAMVDIVCASAGIEVLCVDEIVCSPLNVGSGTVKCAHGTFPVPAPATLELLKGAPVYSSGVQAELITPTGAAIVKTLAKRFAPFPEVRVEKIGYGAGTREFPDHANVLRLTIGETQASSHVAAEIVSILEANIDDLNPQIFGYVLDRLLEEGALDAFAAPVQMKKNRPGMLLTVLCKPEDTDKVNAVIFRETSTLGVRRREEKRQVLARKFVNVTTRWGTVRIKLGSMNGTVTNYAPEYEDCRRIATEHHVPLKIVMQEAIEKYLQQQPLPS
ncbi:MAG: nickel pincer cofactor biosynthesis protein LarC [Acidobacteriaceae bacterium]|nr:nickel pincer cofactor biosynthesis protein LarC [Acidobacteriaceae bacterium]